MTDITGEESAWLLAWTVYDPDLPGERTLYFSDRDYQSRKTDTPALQHFEPRLLDPGSFAVAMYSGGRTSGEVEIGYGSIVLDNTDAGLDFVKRCGFGRALKLWELRSRNMKRAEFADAVLRFRGFARSIDAEISETVTINAEDALSPLGVPFLTGVMAGTSTGTGLGVEGGANLKGTVKPAMYGGLVRNVSPLLGNAADEIYCLRFDHEGARLPVHAITALRNGGETYVLSGDDRADLAALEAATPAGGEADTCLAEALFKTNGAVTALITADVTVEADPADRTAAQVAATMLAEHGFTLDAASVTAADTAAPYTVGILIDDPAETILQAVSRVLESIGGYLVPTDTPGTYAIALFREPAATPDIEIEEWMILDESGVQAALLPTDDDNDGVPSYRSVLHWDVNWTPQDPGSLLGSVSQDDRDEWAAEDRTDVQEDTAVLTPWPNSRPTDVYTVLDTEADATAENTRRLTFQKSDKSRLRLPFHPDLVTGIAEGDTARLTFDRFGITAGTDFLVIGRELGFGDDVVFLDLLYSDAWS